MSKIRIENDTDETIIIEPGDTVEVRGQESTIRTLASRVTTLTVEKVREL